MGEARRRVLRVLAAGPARVAAGARPGTVLIESGKGTIAVAASALATLAADGLVALAGDRVQLAGQAGDEKSSRRVGRGDPLAAAPREVEPLGGDAPAAVNWAESPLASLMRRRNKDGAAFLSADEFSAGERLRSDYTRGQLMPRLGANWVASVASGRRGGGTAAELTDAALAARSRVDKAIRAVGPELSGVLIDVCCFLKGLEQVESERGWPVRSAKIVLKTALGVLHRHYAPGAAARAGGGVLHWGAEDYKPRVEGKG